MSILRNLKPHCFKFKLIGETGDGKTSTAAVSCFPECAKFLEAASNIEKTIVYTSSLDKSMVCAVKIPEEIFSTSLFTQAFTKTWAKLIIEEGRILLKAQDREDERFRDFYREETESKELKKFFSSLGKEKSEDLIKKLISLYHSYNLGTRNIEIYNYVKTKTHERDNTSEFFTLVVSEVERYLDLSGEEFKKKYWEILDDLNEELKSLFFRYFNRSNLSSDGYYYREINLDDPEEIPMDEELEELACELVYYVPMHEKIKNLLETQYQVGEVFKNREGDYIFAMIDTPSPMDSFLTEEEAKDLTLDFKMKNVDALLLMLPILEEPSIGKINLYRNIVDGLRKDVPIFLLNNKLDLYMDTLVRKSIFDDPLSTEMSEVEVNVENMINEVEKRKATLRYKLTGKKLFSLSYYLKRDHTMPKELVDRYNVMNAIKDIFVEVVLSLGGNTKEHLSEEGYEIDEKKFQELVNYQLIKESVDKKVFSPALSDIAKNIGYNPERSEYLDLRRQLKHGETIDGSYSDLSIKFTEILKSLLDDGFLSELISKTLSIKGKNGEEERLKTLVKDSIEPWQLVEKLIYKEALLEAERVAFSDRLKLQNLLENSFKYFNRSNLDKESYNKALLEMVEDAIDRAL